MLEQFLGDLADQGDGVLRIAIVQRPQGTLQIDPEVLRDPGVIVQLMP
ncbi:hypothetical protein ACFW95_10010 [Streptomyces sp. NPDC059474]